MKRRNLLRLLFYCAVLLLTCAVVVSCDASGDDPPTVTSEETLPDSTAETTAESKAEETMSDPNSSYVNETLYSVLAKELTVVRPDSSSDALSAAAVKLRNTLSSLTGATLGLKNDWVRNESEFGVYEILVGETNRPESKTALVGLAEDEYRVAVVGTRLVIAAHNDRCLSAAVEAFLADITTFTATEGKIQIPLPYELRAAVPIPDSGILNPTERTYAAMNFSDMKCLWISQFDLTSVYSSGGSQRKESAYRTYVETVLNNTVACGFNTVILQMRPNADSMYPSDYYPPSAYVVGKYGKEFSYDPVKIFIEMAHARGLSVQAWINPLRGMSESEMQLVQSRYVIRQWCDESATSGTYMVKVGDRWYLNPAYAEVRQLIVNGATEILMRYDVDGLHMDDYFYPTTDASFDASAYAEYRKNGGTKSLADFRREQLNLLVKALYDVTKAVDRTALFGISPAGNWNNVYNSHYADVYTWCGEAGYLDYICPQVYFGMEHASYDFKKTCNTWKAMIKTDSVKLVVGMTLGKAKSGSDNYAGSGSNEWKEHKDVLLRCLQYTTELPECTGVAYFCYQYFYHPTGGTEVAETKAERDNFLPLLKTVTWNDVDAANE